jgi:hypothetical protein
VRLDVAPDHSRVPASMLEPAAGVQDHA